MKKNIIFIIIGIIVIAIAWWIYSAQPEDEILSMLEPNSDISTIESEVTEEATAEPIKAMVEPETADLIAISPYTGTGIGTRSYDGTTFTHTVTADIGDPASGKFYEGWLVMKTANGPQFFSTGKLTKSGSAYVLNYTANKNYPSHKDVVITEETTADGLDNKPEAHVLEGTF